MSHPKARTEKVAQRQYRRQQAAALETGIEAWDTNIVIGINKGAAFHTEGVLKAYHFLSGASGHRKFTLWPLPVFPGEPIEEHPATPRRSQ